MVHLLHRLYGVDAPGFTFTLVLVLQGNVATKLSYGGKFFILIVSHFFLIPTLKEFKNRPTFDKVTVKIKVTQFF